MSSLYRRRPVITNTEQGRPPLAVSAMSAVAGIGMVST
jgi:hypothetical protein